MRARIGRFLRTWADRIDYRGAPRALGWYFTYETGEGMRFREDGKGCRLWYLGEPSYDKAHTEADSAAEDAARGELHQLVQTAMTEPDPSTAGEAVAKLRDLIFQGSRA